MPYIDVLTSCTIILFYIFVLLINIPNRPTCMSKILGNSDQCHDSL